MSRIIKTFIFNGLIHTNKDYDPNYIIAADTDSVYIDLSKIFDRDDDPKEVIKFADYLGETVNGSFPQFMKDIFNVSSERAKPIQTEREVVSDKSYFLAKKKYVMHVINSEGIEVDKIKSMGVEIKRTDTPEIIQNLLKDLVNMLMDQQSFEEVQLFIDKFKEYYHNQPMLVVGRPMGIKGLKKYETKFNKQKTMKGFPYHIRASLFYNSLCDINDKKIESGDKIRIVYLNNPKSKYIALPVDRDEYPAFINSLNIDWNAQWETVVKKINIFLIPIGYDKESRQKKLVKSLLVYK